MHVNLCSDWLADLCKVIIGNNDVKAYRPVTEMTVTLIHPSLSSMLFTQYIDKKVLLHYLQGVWFERKWAKRKA